MSTPEQRAAARKSWPIRRISLAEEGGADDLRAWTTAEERLAMMWPLALDAYPSIPDYPRNKAPGIILRPGPR